LANISVTTNTHKQSTVTFEVFVLWLYNQHYYTCDIIGIKMTYRDLPYYEGIRLKHSVNIYFMKISTTITQTIYIPLKMIHNFIVSTPSKHWLICHSMLCTAIYSSRDSDPIKYGRPSQDCGSVKKTSSYSSSLQPWWLFSLPLVTQWLNFCLMYSLIILG